MVEEPTTQEAPAEAKKSPDDLRPSDVMPQILILMAVLFVAAFLYMMAGRLKKRPDPTAEGGLSLTDFRELYDDGEITKEEYEKIRLKMADKMKADLGLSPPPPAPPKSE